MPKISVLLPAYNHEKYISATLTSLLSQSEQDIEIIVVDDGSTDRTGEIIRQYAQKDARIKAIWQENQGVAMASSTALHHATGEWFVMCASDDIVPPNAYRDMLRQSSNVDVVIAEFSQITDNGTCTRVRMQHWRKKNCFDALFAMPTMWAKLVRRNFVVEHGIEFSKVKLSEDLVFLAHLSACSPRYTVIKKDVYHYRNNPRTISTSMTHRYSLDFFKAHIDGRFQVLEICEKAHIPNAKSYVFLDSIPYIAQYLTGMEEEDIDEALLYLKKLLVCAPSDFRTGDRFEKIFGVTYPRFIEMDGREYLNYVKNRDPFEFVLSQYEIGNIGLHYVWHCVKNWVNFKRRYQKEYLQIQGG